MTVSCARCGHDWPEGDPGVRYASGDWWCNWEGECDDRMGCPQTCHCGHPHLPGTVMCYACDLPLAPETQCEACRCDPADPGSLGGHGAGACINPACPAGCYEEVPDDRLRV